MIPHGRMKTVNYQGNEIRTRRLEDWTAYNDDFIKCLDEDQYFNLYCAAKQRYNELKPFANYLKREANKKSIKSVFVRALYPSVDEECKEVFMLRNKLAIASKILDVEHDSEKQAILDEAENRKKYEAIEPNFEKKEKEFFEERKISQVSDIELDI